MYLSYGGFILSKNRYLPVCDTALTNVIRSIEDSIEKIEEYRKKNIEADPTLDEIELLLVQVYGKLSPACMGMEVLRQEDSEHRLSDSEFEEQNERNTTIATRILTIGQRVLERYKKPKSKILC